MVEINVKLLTPEAPRFIRISTKGMVAKEGYTHLPSIPVSDLTKEDKDLLAEEWRKGLDVAARQQRKDMKKSKGEEDVKSSYD